MDKQSQIEKILEKEFSAKHVKSTLSHFARAMQKYQQGDNENCIHALGKFCESNSKSLLTHCRLTIPTGRDFKVGNAIQNIKNTPKNSFHDSIRVTIPRAIEFVYDIASNRGRHDPTEVNPNEIDASVAVAATKWILAEMIRVASKGKASLEEASDLIQGLAQKTFPIFEEIDGCTYVNTNSKLSAPDLALLLLYKCQKIEEEELIRFMLKHHHKRDAARMAIKRGLKGLVAEDSGKLSLRGNGRKKAEELMMMIRL